MTRQRRSFTAEERAEAVGLATAMGVTAAGRRLGIGHTTISAWMRSPSPAMQAVIVRTREDVAARLWEAVTLGVDVVMLGLADPRARLSDKAQALRIVGEQYQLLTGGATSRTEAFNVNADARSWADGLTDDEQRALVQGVQRELALRNEGALTERELEQLRGYLDAQTEDSDE